MDWQGFANLSLTRGLPLNPPGLRGFQTNLLVTILIVAVAAPWLSRWTKVRWWRVALWLLTVAMPLAYTWTVATGAGTPGCHWGQPPWAFVPQANNPEITFNILMLVPAGAAAWLWPDGPRRLAALFCALVTPAVVEFGQYLFPQLHRACQAGDIINNVIGVLVGWSLVAGVWSGVRIWRGAP